MGTRMPRKIVAAVLASAALVNAAYFSCPATNATSVPTSRAFVEQAIIPFLLSSAGIRRPERTPISWKSLGTSIFDRRRTHESVVASHPLAGWPGGPRIAGLTAQPTSRMLGPLIWRRLLGFGMGLFGLSIIAEGSETLAAIGLGGTSSAYTTSAALWLLVPAAMFAYHLPGIIRIFRAPSAIEAAA